MNYRSLSEVSQADWKAWKAEIARYHRRVLIWLLFMFPFLGIFFGLFNMPIATVIHRAISVIVLVVAIPTLLVAIVNVLRKGSGEVVLGTVLNRSTGEGTYLDEDGQTRSATRYFVQIAQQERAPSDTARPQVESANGETLQLQVPRRFYRSVEAGQEGIFLLYQSNFVKAYGFVEAEPDGADRLEMFFGWLGGCFVGCWLAAAIPLFLMAAVVLGPMLMTRYRPKVTAPGYTILRPNIQHVITATDNDHAFYWRSRLYVVNQSHLICLDPTVGSTLWTRQLPEPGVLIPSVAIDDHSQLWFRCKQSSGKSLPVEGMTLPSGQLAAPVLWDGNTGWKTLKGPAPLASIPQSIRLAGKQLVFLDKKGNPAVILDPVNSSYQPVSNVKELLPYQDPDFMLFTYRPGFRLPQGKELTSLPESFRKDGKAFRLQTSFPGAGVRFHHRLLELSQPSGGQRRVYFWESDVLD
ncbi:MAG: hypothetical protein U0931_14180 [Vulcanimicrobiota bacterium]